MDITRYDETIQGLYKQYKEYVRLSDARAMGILKKLRKAAVESGDDALIGHVHYSIAFTEYFVNGNYGSFLKHLRLSADHLMRTDDIGDLGHVFYLIAIEALNTGMYDISFTYFLRAQSMLSEAGEETSAAILLENVGDTLLLLGDYKEARRYFRRSLKSIRKDPGHIHYYSNVSSLYLNEGAACLSLGDTDGAAEACGKAARFIEENDAQIRTDTRLYQKILSARIAVTRRERKKAKTLIGEIIPLLQQTPRTVSHVDEVRKLSETLMENGWYEPVGELIRVLEEKGVDSKALRAHQIIADLKADYYAASGDDAAFLEACREQDRVYTRISEEGKKNFSYSTQLIRLVNDLKSELEQVRARREELLFMAETDALTRLPNRHAMNVRLEQAFEDAYTRGTRLGVCVMDVDGLKKYNDTYGHPAGDHCLVRIGEALREIAKDPRIHAARYGGDEFVLIYEGMTNQEIRTVALSLKKKCMLHISQGICNAVPSGKNKSWDFLASADKTLYKVKKSGGAASDPGIRFGRVTLSE